jgi:hypothetical protein
VHLEGTCGEHMRPPAHRSARQMQRTPNWAAYSQDVPGRVVCRGGWRSGHASRRRGGHYDAGSPTVLDLRALGTRGRPQVCSPRREAVPYDIWRSQYGRLPNPSLSQPVVGTSQPSTAAQQ